MNTIGQVSNICVTKATLQGCANGIPYLMVVSDGCCDASTLSYINLEDGTISNTRPVDFKLGECPSSDCPPIYETESFVATAGQTEFTLAHTPYVDVSFTRNGSTLIDSAAVVTGNVVTYVAAENNNLSLLSGDDITISYVYKDINCTPKTVDSSICFEFDDNGDIVPIRVVSVNGSTTYYENDVLITDSSRISTVEAWVAVASSSNVVCCPCATIPDGQVCYSISGSGEVTYQAVESMELSYGTAGTPLYIPAINIRNIAADTYVDTIVFSPALQIWDGTSYISNAAFTAALNSVNYLQRWQAVDPRFDRFLIVTEFGFPRVYLIDDANGYTVSTRIANHDWDTSNSSTGDPLSDTVRDGAFTDVTLPVPGTDTFYKVVTANGDTQYYQDDVLLTDAGDIADAQANIALATPSDVVDCGGGSSSIIPPYKTCYAKEPQTISKVSFGPTLTIAPTLTTPRELFSIDALVASSPSICDTLVFSSPIQYFDGTNRVDISIIREQLIANNYLEFVQGCMPCIDTLEVSWNLDGVDPQLKVLAYRYSSNSVCDAEVVGFDSRVNISSNGVAVGSLAFTSVTRTFTVEGTTFEAYHIAGVTTYFENGFEITSEERLAEVQFIVENATEADIVCCTDCGTTPDGSETKIQAGTGIDITGSGTVADPYIIAKEPDVAFSNLVYVNDVNANTATIFDLNNPPTTNDDALKQNDSYLYIGTDGSTWVWNTSSNTYTTYVFPSTTKRILKASRTSTTSIANPGANLVSWPTTGALDINTSVGAWNATTGVYTVNRAGYYRISAAIQFDATTWAGGDTAYWQIRSNGNTMLSNNVQVPVGYTGRLVIPYAETIVFFPVGVNVQLFVGHTTASNKVVSNNDKINQLIIEEI